MEYLPLDIKQQTNKYTCLYFCFSGTRYIREHVFYHPKWWENNLIRILPKCNKRYYAGWFYCKTLYSGKYVYFKANRLEYWKILMLTWLCSVWHTILILQDILFRLNTLYKVDIDRNNVMPFKLQVYDSITFFQDVTFCNNAFVLCF